MERPTKWDLRFLRLARSKAQEWSKDPSTQVGAIIVDDRRRERGFGYNGFPRGVIDSPERYADRDLKYKIVVHAEINAVLNSVGDIWGCTLYTWPFMPCSCCAGVMINAGIMRVVSLRDDNPRWQESFKLTRMLFDEARVALDLYQVDEL